MLWLESIGAQPMRTWTIAAAHPGNLAGIAASVATLALVATRPWSLAALRVIDATFLVVVCACWAAMGMGAEAPDHAKWFVLLAYTNTIGARAAFVPSDTRTTLTLSVVASVIVLWRIWLIHDASSTAPVDRVAFVLIPAAWCAVAVIVATVVSTTIYGLRREAARAQKLGQYQLERKIGEGGMGVVYRAHHGMLRRPTAVKLLSGAEINESHLRRFEREVRMTALLSHPNIVTVYDFGRTPEGRFYYAMEYLDGLNLQELVERFGPVDPPRAIHLLRQVCAALAEAHEHELIHRDVKPANILLTHRRAAHDHIKVLDFGLVRDLNQTRGDLTQASALAGTPAYLAPETILHGQADPRADLYAAGAVAYFLLTGAMVFEGPTVLAICSRHLTDTPERPSLRLGRSLPAELESLVLRCLEKDPAARPQTALELGEALTKLTEGAPWRREDAQRWWDRHAAEVSELRAREDQSLGTNAHNTIAVDLSGR